MIATLPLLRCPQCHGELELSTERALCSTGHEYRVEGKTVNFLGATREKFHDQPFDHSAEASGIAFRTDNYLIPWLRRYFGEDISRLRVLEDGAGGGAQIEAYLKHGVDAHGIDPGPRSELWSRTRASGRCHVADGTQLPFADCTFDAVTSSGVLEHVGEPRTVPQMDPCQSAYMRARSALLVWPAAGHRNAAAVRRDGARAVSRAHVDQPVAGHRDPPRRRRMIRPSTRSRRSDRLR